MEIAAEIIKYGRLQRLEKAKSNQGTSLQSTNNKKRTHILRVPTDDRFIFVPSPPYHINKKPPFLA
jgi:hypothetical protein